MHRGKPQIASLWKALDEAAFGAERTLNLREVLPSAAEARARTEQWLRGRQLTRSEEVLIITGRGNQSPGGIGIVKREILAMLPSLRRRGVVESWREHSPGSIVVRLAPMSALLEAPRRRRDRESSTEGTPDETVLAGLQPETLRLLEDLAMLHLTTIGVTGSQFIRPEMVRSFSVLVRSLPEGSARETALHAAIREAIEELSGQR